jgi:hypothetical protein
MMAASAKARSVWLCGAAALVAIVVASLIPCQAPAAHWASLAGRAFPGYFTGTSIFCLASPRPFVVAASLMKFAALLEALQGLKIACLIFPPRRVEPPKRC